MVKNKKSYFVKSNKGNIASVTFEGSKKPSKKTVEALKTIIDLAFNHLSKQNNINHSPGLHE